MRELPETPGLSTPAEQTDDDRGRLAPAPDSMAGTAQDFPDFYRDSIVKLIRFLLWMGASFADAADIAQETMRLALRSWQDIKSPMAWVRRVGSREYARRLASIEEPCEDPPEATALLPRPADAAEWEQEQEVLRLLSVLPPRQRQVMAWTVDGYEPAEIARQLQIKPEAVRSSLLKARRTLAQLLRDEEGGQQR